MAFVMSQPRWFAANSILALLPLLNSGKVDLLDNSRLVSQLCGLERRTARSGKDSVDHPPGQHDDVANAVAGACVLGLGRWRSLNMSARPPQPSAPQWPTSAGGSAWAAARPDAAATAYSSGMRHGRQ